MFDIYNMQLSLYICTFPMLLHIFQQTYVYVLNFFTELFNFSTTAECSYAIFERLSTHT